MPKIKKGPAILLTTVLIAVAVELPAGQQTAESDFSIRKSGKQTVLYTVYRGPYDSIGKPIGQLYTLAMKNNITPRGPASLVYLNNPQNISPEHYLTEIRIPVAEDAIKHTGELGVMTDVKTLQPTDIAVMKKLPGQMDYGSLYNKFYQNIAEHGYRPTDNVIEVFTDNMMGGDYSRMKSEIMVPIVKIDSGK
jgi:effector-binding domain-containing protein